MNPKRLAGLCLGIGWFPLTLQAADFGEALANLSPSKVLENRDGRYNHWNGIGRIESTDGMRCTATLLDTRSPASPAGAPAYLLTSGHCVEKKNGLIVTDRAVKGTVQFNYFTDSKAHTFALKRIVWSSMQGVDMALIELQDSLGTLIDAGIEPIRIAEEVPAEGRDILLVGAPLKPGTGHLRLAACTQQNSGEVLEQPWLWRHTVKNQCLDAGPGGSGSPVLTRDSNEVFAVLGTTTQGNPTAAPAELPKGFPVLSLDSSYGNPVTFLRHCFVDGVLSQEPEQCSLFPVFSVTFKTPAKHYAKIGLDEQDRTFYPDWNLNFSLDTPFYRYKIVDQASECESPHHYSPALAAEDTRINDPIGPEPGMHRLCIVGVTSAEERPSPGLMRNALTLAVELLAAGPTDQPKLDIVRDNYGFNLYTHSNPRGFSHHTGKSGPPQSTDCANPEGYRQLGRPRYVPASSLPLKVCTRAHDVNGQASVAHEHVLPELPQEERRPLPKTRFSYVGQGDQPSFD